VPGVDDRAVADGGAGAEQEARHLVDRLLRGREADALQRASGQVREALERQC
jgi:hypothetical protein